MLQPPGGYSETFYTEPLSFLLPPSFTVLLMSIGRAEVPSSTTKVVEFLLLLHSWSTIFARASKSGISKLTKSCSPHLLITGERVD